MTGKRFVATTLAAILTVGSCPLTSTVSLAATPDASVLTARLEASAEKSDKGATAAPSYEYAVSEMGSFKGNKDDITFSNDAATIKKGDAYQLLGQDGKPLMDGQTFESITYWGNGVYEVCTKKGDVKGTGLVRIDGTVLVPCEAACIASSPQDKHDARFVEVAYAEDRTSNKDEAFVSASSSSVHIGTGADTYYKGSARVLDLKTGKFVEGVKITAGRTDAFADLGSSFAIEQDDSTVLYDETGKELWKQSGDSTDLYSRCILWSKDGKYQVIDAAGKSRYTSEERVNDIITSPSWSGGDYLAKRADAGGKSAGYQVVDFDGKPVFDRTLSYVAKYYNGMFIAKRGEDDKDYVAVNLKGDIVMHDAGAILEGILNGYNKVTKSDNKDVLLKGDKTIAEGKSGDDLELLVSVKDNKGLVLNDGTYSMSLDELELEALDLGLATGRQSNSMLYGLYDMFTGKQVIKDEYDIIRRAGGRIYAFHDGTWTVFGAKLSQK